MGLFEGFEKKAMKADSILAGLGVGAGLAGLGALSGHISHVGDKLDAARRGKDHKEETFIQKHPKLTGAMSLGLAPALSSVYTKKERDAESEKARGVMKAHPVVGRALSDAGR